MAFPDCEFLCITECDDTLYEKAFSWIRGERKLAIISESERVSPDPRVQIYHLQSPLQIDSIIKKIAWSAVVKDMRIVGNRFKEEIEHYHRAAFGILSEASDYWTLAMRNAKRNKAPYRRGMDLKGAFQKVPAVIVGAGPSLKENGKFLSEFAGRALIFAGGTALNSIEIEPHFAASIDAAAPYRAHPFSEIPFCYQSRMNPEHFLSVRGEKILFPDSACPAINWILNEEEPFDGGWTVGNFLTEVALLMGCSPIFFLGMDFCYKDKRKYAEVEADMPKFLVEVDGFVTQKDWILAARWTEKKKASLFDLSQGMLNLPKLTIEAALKMCPEVKNLNIQEKILSLNLNLPNRWEEWEASLQRCQKGIEEMEEEVVYQKLLLPLWEIWAPLFEGQGEIELHRKLFFQRVLEEHATILL